MEEIKEKFLKGYLTKLGAVKELNAKGVSVSDALITVATWRERIIPKRKLAAMIGAKVKNLPYSELLRMARNLGLI